MRSPGCFLTCLSGFRSAGEGLTWDSGAPCSRVGSAPDCGVSLDKLPSLSEPQVTSWAIPSSASLGF